MSLFQCDDCGCVENTACCNYYYEHVLEKQPKRCSACTQVTFGSRPKGSGWHGRFSRVFLPKGMFITNSLGNLSHKETKETDYRKYAIRIDEVKPLPPLF